MRKVILLGDSILKGILLGDDKQYHLTNKINWLQLGDQFNVELINMCKMGCTIDLGLNKLKKYLVEVGDKPYACVIEFGGNDADYFWDQVGNVKSKNHLPKTPLNEFKDDLKDLVNLLKSSGIKPILMTLPPINAKIYYNWFTRKNISKENKDNIKYFLGDIGVIYRRQEMYSDAIMEVATAFNCDIVNIREDFLKSNNLNSLLCADGIHPNANGQKIIVKKFLDRYNPLKN